MKLRVFTDGRGDGDVVRAALEMGLALFVMRRPDGEVVLGCIDRDGMAEALREDEEGNAEWLNATITMHSGNNAWSDDLTGALARVAQIASKAFAEDDETE